MTEAPEASDNVGAPMRDAPAWRIGADLSFTASPTAEGDPPACRLNAAPLHEN